ncbi:MAG: amidohydrolase family protein [Alphaproteobacteria bacterium]
MTEAKRIDAHAHVWQLARGDYDWLTPTEHLAPIYRDFTLGDYDQLRQAGAIDQVVLVQAAATIAETEFLLEIAGQSPFVAGVVVWVDFASPDAGADLARLAQKPFMKGVRPMIQDIPDPNWMLQPGLDGAFRAVIDQGLAFDALTKPQHLKNLLTLLARYPDLRTVVCHASKPDISARAFDEWADNIGRIASDTNAKCKLSGLVTEAGPDWTTDDLRPYVDHLLATFGPGRLIWGSDWPVCTLAASFDKWCAVTGQLLTEITSAERDQILGTNATQFYRL